MSITTGFPTSPSINIAGGLAFVSLILLAVEPIQGQVFTPPDVAKPKPKAKPKNKVKAPKRKPVRAKRTTKQPTVPRSYGDPAEFCKANPNVDNPLIAGGYNGEQVPTWLSYGASESLGLTPSKNKESVNTNLTWRCMDGAVWACAGQYCEKQDRMVGAVDKRAYLTSYWRDVSRYSPFARIGDVEGSFTGNWQANIKGKGFIFKVPFEAHITMNGGTLNSYVGRVNYYGYSNLAGRMLFCTTNLRLMDVNGDRLLMEERTEKTYADSSGYSVCPIKDQLAVTRSQGRLWTEWIDVGKKKPKVKIKSWAMRVQ